MAKGKKHGKRARTQGEKNSQAFRTRANKERKYRKLLEKFPNAKEKNIWKKKIEGDL